MHSFGSAVSRFTLHHLNVMKLQAWRLRSNAAQVAGLGRIYFVLLCHGSSRIHTDKSQTSTPGLQPFLHLIIRFLFSYTDNSTCVAEKNGFVFRFPKALSDIHKSPGLSIAVALRTQIFFQIIRNWQLPTTVSRTACRPMWKPSGQFLAPSCWIIFPTTRQLST